MSVVTDLMEAQKPPGDLIESIYEAQLVVAQGDQLARMLSRGLAHHFNSLLGGMLGLVSLAPSLEKQALGGLCERLSEQIDNAVSMTRTMLTVARPTNEGDLSSCEVVATTRDAIVLAGACTSTRSLVAELPDGDAWASIPPATHCRVLLTLILRGLAPNGQEKISIRLSREPGQVLVTLEPVSLSLPTHESLWASLVDGATEELPLLAVQKQATEANGRLELLPETHQAIIRWPEVRKNRTA